MNTKCLRLGLTVVCLLLTAANTVLFATYSILGLNTGLVTNAFTTVSTVTGGAVYITYSIVYIYQLIWLIGALVLISRSRPGDPVLITVLMLALFILVQVLQLIVNTVFQIEVSFPILFLIFILLSVVTTKSYRILFRNRFIIAKLNLNQEDLLIRSLLQNGVELYNLWTFSMAIYNMEFLIATRTNPPINPIIPRTITVVILFVFMFVYVLLDLTVLDKFSRYTVTTYLLRIFLSLILIPIITNVGQLILSVTVLLFIVFAFAAKIYLIVTRSKSTPLIPVLDDINK